MQQVLPVIAIIIAGMLTALEGATNGWIGKTSGSIFFSMAIAFGVSAILLLAAALAVPMRPRLPEVAALPWYAWLGGGYTLVTISLAAWATPKLGAGPALVAALVAQTALGLALDHFGLLGLSRSPMNLWKAIGVGLMLGGAILVAIKR